MCTVQNVLTVERLVLQCLRRLFASFLTKTVFVIVLIIMFVKYSWSLNLLCSTDGHKSSYVDDYYTNEQRPLSLAIFTRFHGIIMIK